MYYLVNSDNWPNCVMTKDAYTEIRLQMSTGDFHTHTAIPIERKEHAQYINNLIGNKHIIHTDNFDDHN